MKANELMIGDWVNLYDCDMIYPALVQELQGDKILADWDGTGVCEVFDELYGIPLTPEILEKNGWEVSPYSTLKVDEHKWLEYYHHEGRLREWWKGVDEWQNHAEVKELCLQCECRYVHELQHALRLCGLDDLADNFKI